MDGKKKITIKDVARESGCSIATVSRVINGVNMYYSEETRIRVEEAVKRLNYTPNLNAKELKESRSYNIVYLVPQMDDYYVSILNVMQEIANKKGYSVLILSSNYSKEQEKIHIHYILEKQFAGVIIATGLLNKDYARRMDEVFAGIPVVMLECRFSGNKVPVVNVDVEKLCCQAVEHFIQQGHRKIAYISAPCKFSTLTSRFRGYVQAMKQNGIELDKSLIYFDDRLGKTDFHQCYDVMQKILKNHKFTAMLVISDWAAAASLRVAGELGESVPEDLSVIGFDNAPFTEYVKPQLSTISQNSLEVGKKGIKMLFERIEGRAIADAYIEGQLILRQSTGPCRRKK